MKRDKMQEGASRGDAVWDNASRPRGGQRKIPKEILGTPREEGTALWWEHRVHSSRAFH